MLRQQNKRTCDEDCEHLAQQSLYEPPQVDARCHQADLQLTYSLDELSRQDVAIDPI